MLRFFFVLCAISLSVGVAHAQDNETLADIRQELTVLSVEMQKLTRELSTTGTMGTATVSGSVLERVDAIENELRRLTARTEELSLRVEAVAQDGTRRVADLEFRLVELEGGDVSTLGQTSTLGGDLPEGQVAVVSSMASPSSEPTAELAVGEAADFAAASPTAELAVGEAADFAAARKALEAGEFADAAARLKSFNETYPGSPVATKAALAYGAALEGQGDMTGASRAYLDAFRREPTGEDAPEALYRLGNGLGRLGQTAEACKTLAEVSVRFPGGEPASKAEAERSRLGCS